MLAEFIKEENISYLGTQELTKKYSNKLKEKLGNNHEISGEYRYGHLSLINQFNESNAILPINN